MGCCSSALANDSDKFNTTLNGYYTATSNQKRGSKRSYSSHISNGSSSGVSSACTSPSRRSILSRRSSTPASNQESNSPKAKTRNFNLIHKDVPTAFEMLSICDDFGEGAKMQQHQENRSFGYYSESMSTGSAVSTPSSSCLRRTQDTSLNAESAPVSVTPTPSDLEMEMYMMSRSQGLMPKTSSPIFQRKDVTFDAVAAASPPSHSYQKWANYLQNTPTYMLHNVTDIPEAIAGHFSPLDFPAFTDLEEMESAAKRFKVDIHLKNESEEDEVFYQKQIPKPSNVTHTITTDL
ncbi:hypothetical protein FF38_04880 [Lucilia cuprina]|uniref:Uncharacterized protein n=1 Tax=Lucilia cuprina TaxID=7375 RepID=A0A0L0C8T4_LUCCU|nr:hypothetical protein CVS40_2560 [Lucilia cuprina]KNC28660.1 hypothetical protein FF38_04880 [Lucilia cuprina]